MRAGLRHEYLAKGSISVPQLQKNLCVNVTLVYQQREVGDQFNLKSCRFGSLVDQTIASRLAGCRVCGGHGSLLEWQRPQRHFVGDVLWQGK